eukprot:scaffold27363_cov124-Isochrysis_galbana.AAC.2
MTTTITTCKEKYLSRYFRASLQSTRHLNHAEPPSPLTLLHSLYIIRTACTRCLRRAFKPSRPPGLVKVSSVLPCSSQPHARAARRHRSRGARQALGLISNSRLTFPPRCGGALEAHVHVCAPVPSTKRSGVPSALKPSSATSPSIPAQAWVLPGRVDWFYIGQARSFPPPSEGTKGKLARAW